jgi:hypothetical protein
MQQNDDWYVEREKKRISQGDVIRNLDLIITSKDGKREFVLTPPFLYWVILSQDCDIDQHYNLIQKNSSKKEDKKSDDQIIETLLACPAFPLEKFILGDHIDGRTMQFFGDTEKARDKIRKNEYYSRYHRIPEIKEKLPELVIDFKRFYTVPIELFDYNFEKLYITSIKDLYRERLSQRFTNYLGRIGLPE